MRRCRLYTRREVLVRVFADKDSDFHSDFAVSLWNSRKQVCETGWQDSVNMSLQTLFDAENTVATPQLFLCSTYTDCSKIVNEWYAMKIEHSVACSFLFYFCMCEKVFGSTLRRSGDNDL